MDGVVVGHLCAGPGEVMVFRIRTRLQAAAAKVNIHPTLWLLKQATGSYTAPMQAIWVILMIGVGAHLFLARERIVQPVPAVTV